MELNHLKQQFQKLLSIFWKGWTQNKSVFSDDEITRFVRPKEKRYVKNNNKLRTAAFNLSKDGGISSCETTGMPLTSVWLHGDKYFASPTNTIIGRGCLIAEVVFNEGLGFEYDDEPPRHANIIGFSFDPALSLSQRQALAQKAKYCKR